MYSELLAHCPEPYLRALPAQEFLRGWRGPHESVVLAFLRPEGTPWLLALGQVDSLKPMIDHARNAYPTAERMTISRRAQDLLGNERHPWDWWEIRRDPEWNGESATALGNQHNEEIAAFLANASPSASTPPGHRDVMTWHGIRRDGQLVAVGAALTWQSGVVVLASIATHPLWRGQGLGRAVTASLTRYCLDQGHNTVYLGMNADNDAARSTYRALGYQVIGEYTSGSLSAD